jgi:hypothetical protein
VQAGTEATPGTNVAANKKFISIGVTPAIQMDPNRFRPMGQKFASVVVPGKEWVEASIDGIGSYSELLWFFASCFRDPGSATTLDTSARKWTFAPQGGAEDNVKTLTIEQGGAVRAHKFNYGLVTDLDLTWNRDEIAVSGTMIGQKLSDGITMTATPTTPPEVPILPAEVDVYLDNTSGTLGTTRLTRVLEIKNAVSSRFNPVWVIDSTQASYVAHVESEPTCEITLLMEADTAGMAQLTQMRAGTTKFLRVLCTSATLAGSTTQKYSLTWDTAVKVKDVGDFSDEDGVYAIEWTFEMVYDTTWGKAFTIDLVNKETTL